MTISSGTVFFRHLAQTRDHSYIYIHPSPPPEPQYNATNILIQRNIRHEKSSNKRTPTTTTRFIYRLPLMEDSTVHVSLRNNSSSKAQIQHYYQS